MTPRQAWWAFWALGLIWGSSFLFIRIAVDQLTTLEVVFLRTGMAAVGLALVLRWRGLSLPLDRLGLRDITVLGVVNTALPFALITWGEKTVTSGLAAVLQATTALFTLVVAHMTFPDERFTARSLTAVALGFAGVFVLGGHQPEAAGGPGAALVAGQAAIVLASFCYAVGGTYSRAVMRHRLEPIVAAAGAMTVTALLTGVAVAAERMLGGRALWPADLAPRVLVAIVVLGVFNTFGAYLLFYSVLRVLGAARTSMVTYVIPPVGLGLGALVLGERFDRTMALGTVMILGGIALVSLRTAPAWVTGWRRARSGMP